MTYLESIMKLGFSEEQALRLYTAMPGLWYGHFVLGKKIPDSLIYKHA